MFNFRRKKKQNLIIRITDVIEIIRSDYENGLAFCLIDFQYHNEVHCMGSCVYAQNADERKENIRFVFDSEMFETVEELIKTVRIEELPLSDLQEPIEVIRAGIINGEALLKSPWGQTRLAAHAPNER